MALWYCILAPEGNFSPLLLCLPSLERRHRNKEQFNCNGPLKVSGLTPCSKQVQLDQFAQVLVQFNAEYLQG